MACFVAISRIQLSDIMDIEWPSCGAGGGTRYPKPERAPRLRVLLEGGGCLKAPGRQALPHWRMRLAGSRLEADTIPPDSIGGRIGFVRRIARIDGGGVFLGWAINNRYP